VKTDKFALVKAAFPSAELVDGDRVYISQEDLRRFREELRDRTYGKIEFKSLSGEDIDPEFVGELHGFKLYRRLP
jgi:hypothetical protein